MRGRGHLYLLTIGFLTIIGAVGPYQAARDVRDGESPQVLDLFRHVPTAAYLRSFEKDLESQSIVAKKVRPPTQYLRYRVFQDTGDQALVGRDSWWFYRPDVRFLTERCPDDPKNKTGLYATVSAIVAFRDQLARRGIQLLVMPVPGKPSIYPDRITTRAVPCDLRCHEHTETLLKTLRAADVEVIDLFHAFTKAWREANSAGSEALYIMRDTHWTNVGARLAAEAVADRIRELGWASPGSVRYDVRSVVVRRGGDVLRMLKCSLIEDLFHPEDVECQQVVRHDNQQPYHDALGSPILVLGDSFLRIYERDEPGSAGFIAHLARELSQPLASIVSDGGASTLVRQELSRKPDLLHRAKLVIWEFVERDVRFGMEGWQEVPLPTGGKSAPLSGDAGPE